MIHVFRVATNNTYRPCTNKTNNAHVYLILVVNPTLHSLPVKERSRIYLTIDYPHHVVGHFTMSLTVSLGHISLFLAIRKDSCPVKLPPPLLESIDPTV